MRSLIIATMLLLFTTLSFATETPMSDLHPRVKLQTSLGDIVIELDGEKAPISTKNFLTYVNEGFYTGTIFHRIIKGFMAQGGGFTTDFEQKPVHASIKNEADNGLKNDRGTLAMARTPDPDSATAQFFINYKDNDFLNYSASTPQGWGYAVFAKVVEGMEIVDEMAKQAVGNRGAHQDVPKTDIIMTNAELLD